MHLDECSINVHRKSSFGFISPPGLPTLLRGLAPFAMGFARPSFVATLSHRRMILRFPFSGARLLASAGDFINGSPCAPFRLVLARSVLFVAFLDVLGHPLLPIRVFRFAASWHLGLSFECFASVTGDSPWKMFVRTFSTCAERRVRVTMKLSWSLAVVPRLKRGKSG